jgi:hypothetical protein
LNKLRKVILHVGFANEEIDRLVERELYSQEKLDVTPLLKIKKDRFQFTFDELEPVKPKVNSLIIIK